MLKEAHVPTNITNASFEGLVTSVLAVNQIIFFDGELPLEGIGHVKPFHISVKNKDIIIAKVLIDNGSALNVFPMTTITYLGLDLFAL